MNALLATSNIFCFFKFNIYFYVIDIISTKCRSKTCLRLQRQYFCCGALNFHTGYQVIYLPYWISGYISSVLGIRLYILHTGYQVIYLSYWISGYISFILDIRLYIFHTGYQAIYLSYWISDYISFILDIRLYIYHTGYQVIYLSYWISRYISFILDIRLCILHTGYQVIYLSYWISSYISFILDIRLYLSSLIRRKHFCNFKQNEGTAFLSLIRKINYLINRIQNFKGNVREK